jgi:hypothetical protein
LQERRGGPNAAAFEPPSFLWKRLFCQMNFLKALPAGANRVASTLAALLIGLKGVLNPKVQVQARRGVTV